MSHGPRTSGVWFGGRTAACWFLGALGYSHPQKGIFPKIWEQFGGQKLEGHPCSQHPEPFFAPLIHLPHSLEKILRAINNKREKVLFDLQFCVMFAH